MQFQKALDISLQEALHQIADPIDKTRAALLLHPKLDKPLSRYVVGNCKFNSKLSHGEPLNQEEQSHTEALDKLISSTEAIGEPLHLFHGPEPWLDYQEHNWKVGQRIKFGFHLSKTLAPWVAWKFANLAPWSLGGLFMKKILFFEYPAGSRHAATDFRCPREFEHSLSHLLENEEFELIGPKDEEFELKGIAYRFQCGLPLCYKYYLFLKVQ